MARVLVTDAHLGSAVAIIRSLGRAGHDVVAAAPDVLAPGLYSRYTGARVVYGAAATSGDDVVDALSRAARRHGADVVIPVTDDVIVPLQRRLEDFPDECTIALPPPDALETTLDKAATVALAARVGVGEADRPPRRRRRARRRRARACSVIHLTGTSPGPS